MAPHDPQAQLKSFSPKHPFFVGIDSDGCAFDTMEVKHKECFIPNIIRHWDLQPVSKFARAAAEFVNLYSKTRGINRFPALVKVFDLLGDWPDVQKRGVKIPEAKPLREWIKVETKLGDPTLTAMVDRTGDPVLKQTLTWSKGVNATIAEMVHGVPPFPFVRECLEKMTKKADAMCVSATPGEALRREWEEHDIAKFAEIIAGQEMGSKKEHLALSTKGKYEKNHVIMVGDAPGDFQAARANDALFFPINPGHEDESWERFFKEGLDRFFAGTYAGAYESALIAEFDKLLPELPPWKK